MKFTKIIKADRTTDALKNEIKILQDSLNKITYNLDNVKRGLRNISREEMNNILTTINTFNKQLSDNLSSKLYGYKLTPEEIQKIKDVFENNYVEYELKEKSGTLSIICKSIRSYFVINYKDGNDNISLTKYTLSPNLYDRFGGPAGLPYHLISDANLDQVINKLSSYISRKSNKELHVENAFTNIENKLNTKIKEGKQKRYVDWYGGTHLKDNSLEILLSIDRKFRHPDEYFDMRGGTPKELQEFEQWENELFNIIDPFVKKYNLELDMHA